MTTISRSNALVVRAPALSDPALSDLALSDDEEVRLSLPETTMVIIGASGLLWALLFGAFNALFR